MVGYLAVVVRFRKRMLLMMREILEDIFATVFIAIVFILLRGRCQRSRVIVFIVLVYESVNLHLLGEAD